MTDTPYVIVKRILKNGDIWIGQLIVFKVDIDWSAPSLRGRLPAINLIRYADRTQSGD